MVEVPWGRASDPAGVAPEPLVEFLTPSRVISPNLQKRSRHLWWKVPIGSFCAGVVDIWERNKELIRKRTDIGEHFTREVIQSIIFIFLPLGERVHLTNQSITTNPLGTKNVFRCE